MIICDTGHNEAGIKEVVQQINRTPHHRLHMVFGMVNDKAAEHILQLLPQDATYYFCKANIPRGKDAGELLREANAVNLKGQSFLSVKEALQAAIKAAGTDDLIFIGGSTFVVAEALP